MILRECKSGSFCQYLAVETWHCVNLQVKTCSNVSSSGTHGIHCANLKLVVQWLILRELCCIGNMSSCEFKACSNLLILCAVVETWHCMSLKRDVLHQNFVNCRAMKTWHYVKFELAYLLHCMLLTTLYRSGNMACTGLNSMSILGGLWC